MKYKTSIVILTYNNLEYTKDCIESIRRYTEKGSYELIIVDNHSTDNTKEWLQEQKDLKIIWNKENLGFPVACNQAIKIANRNNDILLLNNDTIVTKNWLTNLKKCLYSNKKIGAVGSVCNHDENLQGSSFTYQNFEEMQRLAEENNISDPTRWEEKIFLIGFCLLIKRKVIHKIKKLDEKYSPGYVEDNDLSLKIVKLGYQLMLCHDSFIHHYLGSSFRNDLNKFYPILNKNREYFEKKWGFSTFCFDEIKFASNTLIEDPKKILDLSSGIGTNLLKLKYHHPKAIVHGLERKYSKFKIAKKVGTIYNDLSEIHTTYDYILIGNLLEEVKDPILFLKKLDRYISKDGYIVGEIHNISNIKTISQLVNDQYFFENQNRSHHFTLADIYQLFSELNYHHPKAYSWSDYPTENEKILIQKLEEVNKRDYNVSYYSFRFQKKDS